MLLLLCVLFFFSCQAEEEVPIFFKSLGRAVKVPKDSLLDSSLRESLKASFHMGEVDESVMKYLWESNKDVSALHSHQTRNTLTTSLTTVGPPTFNRPVANFNFPPVSYSPIGTNVSYAQVGLSLSAADTLVVSCTVTSAPYDPFSVLYSNFFIPSNSLQNCLIANDDLTSTQNTGFSIALPAGNYVFVLTTSQNNGAGTCGCNFSTTNNVLTFSPILQTE